ncbi:MAG: radical SAM protein [Minisyncoccia bacterium]
MKICLIFPKWTNQYGVFSYFAKRASTIPPLNLAQLAAIAEEQGHEVKIIDGEANDIPNEKMVECILGYSPDIIGLTAATPCFHIVVDLAERIKKVSDIPIAIGGHHITILSEKAFNAAFDFGFIGEAEASWSLFIERFEKNQTTTDIPGILYRDDDGTTRFTGVGRPVQDLSRLPLPARHLLNTKKYQIGTLRGKKVFTTMMTMRGCPYRCIFCNTAVFGNIVRKRSPRDVVNEIREIKEKHGIGHVMFLDDTFTLDKKHTLDICNLLIAEKLKITFECGTRANLIDEELVAKMVEAGLIRISFGLESVNQDIRRIIRKEVPLECYDIANKITSKYGVETLNSCMIGLPGETLETVRETLAFLRRSREIKQANISIAMPYPGTELFNMAKRGDHGLKLMTEDFSKYQRYNSAVMTVGKLLPRDLVGIQNEAFASIYIAPLRWLPMTKKFGIVGSFLTFCRLVKVLLKGKTRFITNRQLGLKD